MIHVCLSHATNAHTHTHTHTYTEAQQYFDAIKSKPGTNPSPTAYADLMSAYSFHGDHTAIRQLLQEVQSLGLPLKRAMVTHLLEAHVIRFVHTALYTRVQLSTFPYRLYMYMCAHAYDQLHY